jgi:photosystem II stability/assembly factor-like uncharacterized protein
MPRILLFLAILFSAVLNVYAQWELQNSHTTADLRGIHSVSGSIGWASGAHGTILRTTDGGLHWGRCAVPPAGEKLDFRGVWAWDAQTAVVMSSGPGDQSRLYRTTDGCAHWNEVRRNTDKDGFWDALVFPSAADPKNGVLLGDPVRGRFFTAEITVDQHD